MNSLSVLQRLGNGHLIDELYGALLDVSGEVVATGKPGVVTVTLKVSHPKGADPLLIVIDEDVKRSLPKTDPQGAMYFMLDGEMHTRDPRQPELPSFRVVDQPDSDVRSLEANDTVREAE